jgi:hypothetical protein
MAVTLTKDRIEMYIRLWQHTDTIRESRSNFIMVAQSMLVVAYFTVPSSNIPVLYAICTLGLAFSLVWFHNMSRLSKRIDWVMKECLFQDPDIKAFVTSAKGVHGKWYITYGLPLITTAFWAFLVFLIH